MVSILIPTFNRADFLLKALNSILRQTVQDFEIIVVDDGSDDNTSQAVVNLNNEKIKYINIGRVNNISTLRNAGLNISKGEIIAFCDDDDLWEPDKLEVQLNYMKNYDFVCSNAFLINEKNEIIKEKYFDTKNDFQLTTDVIILSNYILTPSVVLKRNLLSEYLFDEINFKNLNEDFSLWLKISEKYGIFYINKNLVRIREHYSITRKFENKILIQEMKIKLFKKYLLYGNLEVKNSAVRAILDSHIYMIKLLFNEGKYPGLLKHVKQLAKTLKERIFLKEFQNIISSKIRGFRLKKEL